MTPFWFPGAVAVGLLMFLLGLLTIVVNRVLNHRLHVAVEDPSPDHEDDLTALMDVVKAGAMVSPDSPYAGLHRGCVEAWGAATNGWAHDPRDAYDQMCNDCFDLLGRSADVGLDIFTAEVTQ